VVGGVPFALTRHLARLRRSCEALGIAPPAEERLRAACLAVIDANDRAAATGPVGRVRITVTAGRAPLGPGRDGSAPGLVLLTGPPRVLGPTAAVVVGPWVRNERSPLAGVKATSYAENAVAYRWGEARGADEVLFANTIDELCEGTGTNVFVVVDGVLRTPPLASGCLAGVTRELVLELADVDQAPIPMAALADATEGFLTSSTRDVHPVSTIDGRPLPAPGPVTATLQAAWRAMELRTLDP
jgi:branched-chain amino acid aminotransferase